MYFTNKYAICIVLLIGGFILKLFGQNDLPPLKKYGPYGSEIYTSLNDAVKNSKNTYKLDLSDQFIDWNKDAKKLSKLEQLQALQIGNNSINYLPTEISYLSNLIYFSSKFNPLQSLPKEIGNLDLLIHLELIGAKIDSFPKELCNLSNLKIFHIQNNLADTLHLPECIGNLTNLQDIIIYNSPIDSIPNSIGELKNLKSLVLAKNKIKKLPNEICNLKNLEVLVLDNNEISNLPRNIYELRKLKVLSLRNNQLSSLNDDIVNFRNLAKLDIRGNSFSEEQIEIMRILLPGCNILFDKPEDKK
ncbi:MAG: leucine-rich repeat domain-containing protein [Bacteroidia bacterium]